jgi:hypothetical protein
MYAINRWQRLFLATVLFALANNSSAAEHAVSSTDKVLDYLTDQNGKYTGPTVEDQIALMDTDKNGFADVYEVRAYLVLKHGKDYQKILLDDWESSATGKSCSSPFAKRLYLDNTN